jgi:hypothetical protein
MYSFEEKRYMLKDEPNLVEAFPNADWNWIELSANPTINISYILANQHLPWRWKYVSGRPDMSMEIVDAYPHIKWSYYLSRIPSLSLEDVINRIKAKWDWYYISQYMSFSIDLAITVKKKLHWELVSRNAHIPVREALAHRELPWDWIALGERATISELECIYWETSSLRELGFYGSKRTDFAYVASRNPNVSMSYITTHPELKWEWDL